MRRIYYYDTSSIGRLDKFGRNFSNVIHYETIQLPFVSENFETKSFSEQLESRTRQGATAKDEPISKPSKTRIEESPEARR